MEKDLLSVVDISPKELDSLLSLSSQLKKRPLSNSLKGKTIALLFEKPSTRTRVSFEAGIAQLGGYPLYIDAETTQISRGEPMSDTGHVLGRYVDCICARVFRHASLVEMSESSGKPVINALSDIEHPCQTLSDLMTIKEKFGRLKGLKLAYIGDGNNVCNSLLLGCAMTGIHMSIACPKGYEPDRKIQSKAAVLAKRSGSKIQITQDPKQAAQDADVLYSDVFVSMGDENEVEKRLRDFVPKYTVTKSLMSLAKKTAIYMHCLPAHRGQEVEARVIDGKQSVVFDQAENRMHAQKALLIKLLCK